MAYKCSRIYKDARLHPAVPYKESLWLSMRPDGLPWSEQPTLYFEIRPEGYSYGFILWKPKAEMTEKFRQMLLAKPDEFPNLVKKLEKEHKELLEKIVILSCEEVLKHSKYNQWISLIDLNLQSFGATATPEWKSTDLRALVKWMPMNCGIPPWILKSVPCAGSLWRMPAGQTKFLPF